MMSLVGYVCLFQGVVERCVRLVVFLGVQDVSATVFLTNEIAGEMVHFCGGLNELVYVHTISY